MSLVFIIKTNLKNEPRNIYALELNRKYTQYTDIYLVSNECYHIFHNCSKRDEVCFIITRLGGEEIVTVIQAGRRARCLLRSEV